MKNNHGYKLASNGKRLIATLTEGILFSFLAMGIHVILGYSAADFWNDDFDLTEIVYSAISGLIVGAIFYPLFTGNLGHRIFNLKVISAETGADYKKT